jgi:hypothetical protein
MLTAPTNPVDTDNFPAPLATHASLFQNGRKNILGGEMQIPNTWQQAASRWSGKGGYACTVPEG